MRKNGDVIDARQRISLVYQAPRRGSLARHADQLDTGKVVAATVTHVTPYWALARRRKQVPDPIAAVQVGDVLPGTGHGWSLSASRTPRLTNV